METNDGTKGGILDGKKHSEGGIAAIVVDTKKPVELESGEAIITSKAVEKHHELLSEINQDGGGVPILDPNKQTFHDGGTIPANWDSLVNMSASELQKFYDSEEGKEAGLSSEEAKEQGIKSGRESARWTIKMKSTPKSGWTAEMQEWAKRQVSFISRMKGVDGPLYDEKGNKTRKHLALLIWGHNPKKMSEGGNINTQTINKMEPIKVGTTIINNEASNDEKTWIINDIKNGELILSHSPKFVNPKDNLILPFANFLVLFNDRIISLPSIKELNLENFEAEKMLVELSIKKLELDQEIADLNRRVEDALEETKRAREELMGLADAEEMGEGGTVLATPRLFKPYINKSNYNKRVILIRNRGNDYLAFFIDGGGENYHIAVYDSEMVKKAISEGKWELAKFHSGSMREGSLIKIAEIANEIVNENTSIDDRLKDSYLGVKSKKEVEEFVEIMKSDKKEFGDGGTIESAKDKFNEIMETWKFGGLKDPKNPKFIISFPSGYNDAIKVATNEAKLIDKNFVAPKFYSYEKGGTIPNNYAGKTAEVVWGSFNKKQRKHFLSDHKLSQFSLAHNAKYEFLASEIKNALDEHIKEGQYGEGGNVPTEADTTTEDKQSTISILRSLVPTLKGKEKKACQEKIKELEKE